METHSCEIVRAGESENKNARRTLLKKFSLRRVEPFINKLLTTFQRNVVEMRQRKANFKELQMSHELCLKSDEGLEKIVIEYRAATCCVANLMTSLQHIINVRRQVVDNDLESFDCRITLAFDEFQLFELVDSSYVCHCPMDGSTGHQALVDSRPDNRALMRPFSELLHYRHPRSGTAECQSVTDDNGSSYSGMSSIISSQNLKLLIIPVAGAVIGGAVAGPVGLMAGLKVAKIAAVGGTIVGVTTGTMLKKHAEDRQVASPSSPQSPRSPDSSTNSLPPANPLVNII